MTNTEEPATVRALLEALPKASKRELFRVLVMALARTGIELSTLAKALGYSDDSVIRKAAGRQGWAEDLTAAQADGKEAPRRKLEEKLWTLLDADAKGTSAAVNALVSMMFPETKDRRSKVEVSTGPSAPDADALKAALGEMLD